MNNCNLGDKGFCIIVENFKISPNPQLLHLNLKGNEITNESIEFLTEIYLAQPNEKDANDGKEMKILRLKTLNLSRNKLSTERSNNQLKSHLKGSHSMGDRNSLVADAKQGAKSHVFEEQMKTCPLSKFVSKFYKQVFIEHLDLSYNDQLYNNLALFMEWFFANIEVRDQEPYMMAKAFNIDYTRQPMKVLSARERQEFKGKG